MLSLKGWIEIRLGLGKSILGRRTEYIKRPGNKTEQCILRNWKKKKNQYDHILKCKEAYSEKQIEKVGRD